MTRFHVYATYRTRGGNLGHCAFALVAKDHAQASAMAYRRIGILGRSKINFTIHGGA